MPTEISSERKHLSPFYEDVLDLLLSIEEKLERDAEPTWEVMYTNSESPSVIGWEPFSVTAPSPDVTFIW